MFQKQNVPYFLLSHQRHVCSLCVFAQIVCFGVVFVYPVFYPVLSKGSQSCSAHACVRPRGFVSPSFSPSAVAGQALVVSVEPQTATVREGDTVSFRCQVGRGAQPTQLEWRRGNNQALAGQEYHPLNFVIVKTTSPCVRFQRILLSPLDNVKIGPDGSVMTVATARPGNQGQYRCVATNSAGHSSATAILNIKRELHNAMFP